MEKIHELHYFLKFNLSNDKAPLIFFQFFFSIQITLSKKPKMNVEKLVMFHVIKIIFCKRQKYPEIHGMTLRERIVSYVGPNVVCFESELQHFFTVEYPS